MGPFLGKQLAKYLLQIETDINVEDYSFADFIQ
jgi:hypothetical protein